MSKLRRNNNCFSPRNKIKESSNDFGEIPPNGKLKLSKNKLMSHGEFLNRIQKSLYYSGRKSKMSIPLSDYIAETFSDTHEGYSLNRLNFSTIGNLRSTPCSLILALVYLERLKDADPSYTKHVTPTELFLVSMMVATKFYSGHDEEAPFVNWAECVNTSSAKLLQMELSFLNAIDWKVYVSNEEFFDKVKSLESTLAQRQGINRGFFTYSELNNVMPSVQIAKHFIQSTLVLGLSYTVFVATMVASVFLASQIPGTQLSSPNQDLSNESTNVVAIDNSDSNIIMDLHENMMTTFHIEQINQLNKTDSVSLPVILSQYLNEWFTRDNFCNKSAHINPTEVNPFRYKFSVHGFKMKWV